MLQFLLMYTDKNGEVKDLTVSAEDEVNALAKFIGMAAKNKTAFTELRLTPLGEEATECMSYNALTEIISDFYAYQSEKFLGIERMINGHTFVATIMDENDRILSTIVELKLDNAGDYYATERRWCAPEPDDIENMVKKYKHVGKEVK